MIVKIDKTEVKNRKPRKKIRKKKAPGTPEFPKSNTKIELIDSPKSE